MRSISETKVALRWSVTTPGPCKIIGMRSPAEQGGGPMWRICKQTRNDGYVINSCLFGFITEAVKSRDLIKIGHSNHRRLIKVNTACDV